VGCDLQATKWLVLAGVAGAGAWYANQQGIINLSEMTGGAIPVSGAVWHPASMRWRRPMRAHARRVPNAPPPDPALPSSAPGHHPGTR